MAEPKTKPTDADVGEFLAAIAHDRRRADATSVCSLMRDVTGEEPVVWGTSIVGFGSIVTPGARGASMPWPIVAFAPRSSELVLYLNTAVEPEWFDGLGSHRRGVGCVYVKRLDALDLDVLRRLIERNVHLATA